MLQMLFGNDCMDSEDEILFSVTCTFPELILKLAL